MAGETSGETRRRLHSLGESHGARGNFKDSPLWTQPDPWDEESTDPTRNPKPRPRGNLGAMLQLQGQRAHRVRCKEEHYPICKSAAPVKVWVNLGASAALNPERG